MPTGLLQALPRRFPSRVADAREELQVECLLCSPSSWLAAVVFARRPASVRLQRTARTYENHTLNIKRSTGFAADSLRYTVS